MIQQVSHANTFQKFLDMAVLPGMLLSVFMSSSPDPMPRMRAPLSLFPAPGSEHMHLKEPAAKIPKGYLQFQASKAQVEKKSSAFFSIYFNKRSDCAVDSDQLCGKQWLRQLKK